jgi:hypothetical protein
VKTVSFQAEMFYPTQSQEETLSNKKQQSICNQNDTNEKKYQQKSNESLQTNVNTNK